jgi:hypothetical protein
MRVEFDRSIFDGAACEAGDPGAHFEAFDKSRMELGLGESPQARPVRERVRGLIGLVRSMGAFFVIQVISALLGFWVARWLS